VACKWTAWRLRLHELKPDRLSLSDYKESVFTAPEVVFRAFSTESASSFHEEHGFFSAKPPDRLPTRSRDSTSHSLSAVVTPETLLDYCKPRSGHPSPLLATSESPARILNLCLGTLWSCGRRDLKIAVISFSMLDDSGVLSERAKTLKLNVGMTREQLNERETDFLTEDHWLHHHLISGSCVEAVMTLDGFIAICSVWHVGHGKWLRHTPC